MPSVKIIRYVDIGLQNDEKEIAKILKKEPFRRLESVKLLKERIQLTFSKKKLSEDGQNFVRFRKRVLQISKKDLDDVNKRIIYILENEQKPAFTTRHHKTWNRLEVIELKDKWLVFFV